jgi:hypothetical protein
VSNSELNTVKQKVAAPIAGELSAQSDPKSSADAAARAGTKRAKPGAANSKTGKRVRPVTAGEASQARDDKGMAKGTRTKVKAKDAKAEVPSVGKDAIETKSSREGKKSKRVRDSFSLPAGDYAQIGVLKQRALKFGRAVKKSDLLRAALIALSALSDADLAKTLGKIKKP